MSVGLNKLTPPSELVRFLISAGADERRHSGRTLLEHLEGTYRLMKLWRCEDYLCFAGLFHSVYGTSGFANACVPEGQRHAVSRLIGDAAERLVYLFSIAQRPHGLLYAGATLRIQNRVSGANVAVSQAQARNLVAIECANLAEQGDFRLVRALLHLDRTQRSALLDSSIASNVFAYLNDERRKLDA